MEGFFGVGGSELILILLIAGLVLGPKRIQQVARWLGKTTVELQRISRLFTQQLNAELDALDEDGQLREAVQEVRNVRQEITTAAKEVTGLATKAVKEGEEAIAETKDIVEHTIHPPAMTTNNGEKPSPPPLPKLIDVPEDPE